MDACSGRYTVCCVVLSQYSVRRTAHSFSHRHRRGGGWQWVKGGETRDVSMALSIIIYFVTHRVCLDLSALHAAGTKNPSLPPKYTPTNMHMGLALPSRCICTGKQMHKHVYKPLSVHTNRFANVQHTHTRCTQPMLTQSRWALRSIQSFRLRFMPNTAVPRQE